MWIKRHFLKIWALQDSQPIRILVGLRQTGKSSFLEQIKEPQRKSVTLDDISTREAINRDPHFFLESMGKTLLIDEAQYAPNLFPELKAIVDLHKKARRNQSKDVAPVSYWLTGSNRVLIDREVGESLTGRATYYRFHPLSVAEIVEAFGEVSLETLLFKGGWPELYVERSLDSQTYLNDYIQTTIEKDFLRVLKIEKIAEFSRFLKFMAGRIGQIFNASEIARDAGVKSPTVSEWARFAERMFFLIEIPAYSSNATTRLVKAPKYYFCDVALAVRLQGWSTLPPILISSQIGFFFENIVVTEIVKARDNYRLSFEVYHYRTKDNQEVDFVLEGDGKTILLECKLSTKEAGDYKIPQQLKFKKGTEFIIVSFEGGRDFKSSRHVGINDLTQFLIDTFKSS